MNNEINKWVIRFSLCKHPITKRLNLDFIDPKLMDSLAIAIRDGEFFAFAGKWDESNTIEVKGSRVNNLLAYNVSLYKTKHVKKDNFLIDRSYMFLIDASKHDYLKKEVILAEKLFTEIETAVNELLILC